VRIYFDTSAFVKRYCEEEGSGMVSEIFGSSNEIVTSYWTLVEATAAIDKKVIKGQINEEERDFVLSLLFSDVLDRNITFVKISNEFIEAMIEIILTHHISADDALQLFLVSSAFHRYFWHLIRVLSKQLKEKA